uniref:BPTI/Kunitz inhibitor domain-containing protein n=1 Tax=Amblyomma cajennense TaxID=34607 RepID=A0A023FPM1_AMBCJ
MRVLLVAALLFTSCAAFFNREHGIEICSSGNENQCKALCRTPPDDGPCRALIPRWGWYGSGCALFYYGGCEGNNNSFPTENDCKKACGKHRYPKLN